MKRRHLVPLLCSALLCSANAEPDKPIRIGMIGLDTSHVTAFTEIMHNAEAKGHVPGARVVAAFKGGSPDIPSSINRVEGYHRLHPQAAKKAWHPEVFQQIDSPEWQQLYVNAEHDGEVGAITLSRESYSAEVDQELNRAIDWLKQEGISKVILTGDFHLSTQMVGADTSDFYPALKDAEAGFRISNEWSKTARRLDAEAVHRLLEESRRPLPPETLAP